MTDSAKADLSFKLFSVGIGILVTALATFFVTLLSTLFWGFRSTVFNVGCPVAFAILVLALICAGVAFGIAGMVDDGPYA